MPRPIANSVLGILLVTTLVWGGCISCEQYFMWPGSKGCCAPSGHCKTKKMPATTDTGRACQQIAFDHEKSFDHHIALPVIAGILTARPLIMPYRAAWTYTAATIEPSPPDLQVLHSTFLI